MVTRYGDFEILREAFDYNVGDDEMDILRAPSTSISIELPGLHTVRKLNELTTLPHTEVETDERISPPAEAPSAWKEFFTKKKNGATMSCR